MDGVTPEGDGHDEHGEHSDLVVPGAGPDAAAAAVTVLETWARPDVPYERWWAELSPLLSTAGQQAYAATDPEVLPRLELLSAAADGTGGVTVVAEEDVWARVAVGTTAGVFHVELTRTAVAAEQQGGWRAARIDFPRS